MDDTTQTADDTAATLSRLRARATPGAGGIGPSRADLALALALHDAQTERAEAAEHEVLGLRSEVRSRQLYAIEKQAVIDALTEERDRLRGTVEHCEVEPPVPQQYLALMYFDPADPERHHYKAEVDAEGLWIHSECCADLMSTQTAKAVHEALGRWLADQGKED